MLEVINLPSSARSKNIKKGTARKEADNFVKQNAWIVDKVVRDMKLRYKYSKEQFEELEQNGFIQLWQTYLQKPNECPSYYNKSITNYFLNYITRRGFIKSDRCCFETVSIEAFESIKTQGHGVPDYREDRNIPCTLNESMAMYTIQYNNRFDKDIDNKLQIEAIEKRLSEKSKKIAFFVMYYTDPVNKKITKKKITWRYSSKINVRRMIRKMGVTTKEIRIFEEELKEVIRSLKQGFKRTIINTSNELTNMIKEEIQ